MPSRPSEYKKRPPRRRSLPLATKQNILRFSDFAHAGFFLPRLRRGFGGQEKQPQKEIFTLY